MGNVCPSLTTLVGRGRAHAMPIVSDAAPPVFSGFLSFFMLCYSWYVRSVFRYLGAWGCRLIESSRYYELQYYPASFRSPTLSLGTVAFGVPSIEPSNQQFAHLLCSLDYFHPTAISYARRLLAKAKFEVTAISKRRVHRTRRRN